MVANKTYLQQYQQLSDARYQRSQGNQTGFDDENDNTIDDKARSKSESQQWAAKAANRDKNSAKGTNTMATPNTTKKTDTAQKTKPFDNSNYEIKSLADLQNYSMQSSDRRYNTDKTSEVNYALGSQKNQVEYAVGMDRNAVTRDVGRYTSDNQLKASNYKSYAELQAGLDRNRITGVVGLDANAKQLEGSKFKVTTDAETDRYKWNNVNKTALAEAQIKAGTYGMDQESINARNTDKYNREVAAQQDKKMMDYANYQMSLDKYTRDVGNAERAYSDQRMDRQNDLAAAHSRYQMDLNQKQVARQDNLRQQKEARDQQRAEFNQRSAQINKQMQNAAIDSTYRNQLLQAQVFQIRNDANLKNQQFAATRADLSYNRRSQGRSNLAF